MKNIEKLEILNARPIAYFSGFAGIEIKWVEYGIDDYIIFVAGAWCSNKTAHRTKIYYNGDNAYFRFNNCRISLNDCIRC